VDKRIIVAIAAGIVIIAFAAYLFYDFSLTKGSISELETTKISPDSDPLPSWNNGDSKQKIIEFVNGVTNSSLPHQHLFLLKTGLRLLIMMAHCG